MSTRNIVTALENVELAREVGSSKGAFYHFYKSKETLFLHTLENIRDEIYGRMERLLGVECSSLNLSRQCKMGLLQCLVLQQSLYHRRSGFDYSTFSHRSVISVSKSSSASCTSSRARSASFCQPFSSEVVAFSSASSTARV